MTPLRTWAEISRSRLLANFKYLQAFASTRADLLAVLKADAYGHGATLCAPWLADGAEWLGVTSVEEGVAVRKACPLDTKKTRILIMCGLLPGEEDALLDHALVPTVWELEHIELLAQAAERREQPAGSVPVHLEVDTGMSRQGVAATAEALTPILTKIRATPALHLEGIYTHFASPEVLDAAQNYEQEARFARALQFVAAADFHPTWVHAGNSSTLLGQQMLTPLEVLAYTHHARLLIRPGIALYGYALPFMHVSGSPQPEMQMKLTPVLRWKTRIAALRRVEVGATVGYTATFTAPRAMQLALLSVGYADGLNRKLSNRGHVLVRGRRAAIVGRISMDLTVVDVSEIPDAIVGDEAVLIGEQADSVGNTARITADDHARWAETIPYEVLCAISARVARVAVE